MTQRKVINNILKCIPMLIAIGILCSCENDVKEVASLTKNENEPNSSGKNVSLIYSEDSDVKIKVTAPMMEEYGVEQDKYLEMKKGIKVQFFDSLLNVTSTLTSKYAIHRVGERVMEAKNDVVVVNDKGEQLNTEHLIWNEDSSKIYSDKFVKITTEDEILMGEGMEANQDFTKWKIHKIKGIINVKEETDSSKTDK